MVAPALATVLVAGALAGIAYFLFFKPVVVPLTPSASLPTFQHVNPDGSPPQPEARPEPAPSNPGQYAGLSYRQAGKVADDVCFTRAHTRFPHWSKTPRLTTKELHDFNFDEMPHFNELMICLLTEAPIRYCSSSQRSMIAAEISMYFRGIEYGNNTLTQAKTTYQTNVASGKLHRTFGEVAGDPDYLNQIERRKLVPDSRVTGAIEARLRDGTLTVANRETFSAVAPQPLRLRFANVKPSAPACPQQPWWAFWRGL
jgi:hypothetical protein